MKIALIRKTETSEWVSCRSITNNLEIMYKSRFGEDVKVWTVPENVDKFANYRVFSEIKDKKIDLVVFIDHKPTPLKLIQSMDKAFKDYSPQIIFHVFGDFTLFSPEWNAVSDELSRRNCHFIAASGAQRKLLSHFIPAENLDVLPFPLASDFAYSKDLREKTRTSLGFGDEYIFIYSGRISIQKNVIDLMKSFHSSVNQFGVEAKLLICGEFDDLGVPFLGKVMPHGHIERSFFQELEDCSGNVMYLGNKSHDELKALYCASDSFVSLSTHNDEDYGMSPAEALSCGLPCLLSSWGGFNTFSEYFPQNVSLVPVEIQDESIEPDLVNFRKQIVASKRLTELEREALSNDSLRVLGFKAAGESVTKILPRIKQFEGFLPEFKRFSASFELNPKAPFRSGLGGYSELYKTLYKSYQG